jgi:ubiquinone/menaquinone biosynthesis C-methylase UbiE
MEHYAAKAYKGIGMEGGIARWYAKNTLRDMDQVRKLAVRLTEELPAGGHVLEVAPGPGYLAVELARQPRYRVKGLDISKTFVEIAKRNAEQAKVPVDFRRGNVSDMPFAANTFDLLVCRAAFKNFSQPAKAISEIWRVLKPGGGALIIDLRRDVSPRTINQHVDQFGVSYWSTLMMKLTFRFMLIRRAYTKEQFSQFVAQSPFGRYQMNEDPISLELWLQK